MWLVVRRFRVFFNSKLIESSAGGETEATLPIDSTDVLDSDIIWAKMNKVSILDAAFAAIQGKKKKTKLTKISKIHTIWPLIGQFHAP